MARWGARPGLALHPSGIRPPGFVGDGLLHDPSPPVRGIALDLVHEPPCDWARGAGPLLPGPHRSGVDTEETGEENLAHSQEAANPAFVVRSVIAGPEVDFVGADGEMPRQGPAQLHGRDCFLE